MLTRDLFLFAVTSLILNVYLFLMAMDDVEEIINSTTLQREF